MIHHEMNTNYKKNSKRSLNTTYMKSGFGDRKHRMIILYTN